MIPTHYLKIVLDKIQKRWKNSRMFAIFVEWYDNVQEGLRQKRIIKRISARWQVS